MKNREALIKKWRYPASAAAIMLVMVIFSAGCVVYPDTNQTGLNGSMNVSVGHPAANNSRQELVPEDYLPLATNLTPVKTTPLIRTVVTLPLPTIPVPDVTPENATAENTTMPAANTTDIQLVATLAPTPVPTPPEYLTYKREDQHFSLVYPASWTMQESNGQLPGTIVKFLTPPVTLCNPRNTSCSDFIATFSVYIDPNPDPPGLEEYFNKALSELQNRYQITQENKNSQGWLSGYKAYDIRYVTKDDRGNPEKKVMQVYSFAGGKAFILTYSTSYFEKRETIYPIFSDKADGIVASFIIEKPAPIEG
jgi:hypothetical protein